MMFEDTDIGAQLRRSRKLYRKAEDILLDQANEILRKDLFKEEKVLQNLRQYSRSFDVMENDDCEQENLFTLSEIKAVAITNRLKFLESSAYKKEIPYEAICLIKDLNRQYGKDLKAFKILGLPEAFSDKESNYQRSLFVKTSADYYLLLFQWGSKIKRARKVRYWPMRTFENLGISIFSFTLIVTLSLPTFLITLDQDAEYWSGYRGGTFFHLLFFFTGFTAYLTFAFGINFSSSIWDRRKDF